jgi:hypothetical protein
MEKKYKAVLCKNFTTRMTELSYFKSTYESFIENINRFVTDDACTMTSNGDFDIYTNKKNHVAPNGVTAPLLNYYTQSEDYIVLFNNNKPEWTKLT